MQLFNINIIFTMLFTKLYDSFTSNRQKVFRYRQNDSNKSREIEAWKAWEK